MFIVLRGLVPRIHVFVSAVPRRGWPAQGRPDEIGGAMFLPSSLRDFPRTALSHCGEKEEQPVNDMPDGFVPVAKVDELPAGQMKWVAVDRERLVLANVEGEFYA